MQDDHRKLFNWFASRPDARYRVREACALIKQSAHDSGLFSLESTMDIDNKFSPEQIQMYLRYEGVRLSGSYNMFDPRARELTGLSDGDYLFVMGQFSQLRKQFEEEQDQ
jgi:hypothetical protein